VHVPPAAHPHPGKFLDRRDAVKGIGATGHLGARVGRRPGASVFENLGHRIGCDLRRMGTVMPRLAAQDRLDALALLQTSQLVGAVLGSELGRLLPHEDLLDGRLHGLKRRLLRRLVLDQRAETRVWARPRWPRCCACSSAHRPQKSRHQLGVGEGRHRGATLDDPVARARRQLIPLDRRLEAVRLLVDRVGEALGNLGIFLRRRLALEIAGDLGLDLLEGPDAFARMPVSLMMWKRSRNAPARTPDFP